MRPGTFGNDRRQYDGAICSGSPTGRIETLQGCDQTVLEAGEAVIVTTPTPGGYGAA